MAERGQATVEWVGLVLGVALVLGALAAGAREAAEGESADGLGEAVVERIVCGARRAGAVRGAAAARAPCEAGDLRPEAPEPRPGEPGPAPRATPPRHEAGSGLRSLPGGVAKRGWILCLGYRRWQYDREHPRAPREGIPLRDTARIVNECVNPLSFLFG
jgi:hypothetical protein